MDPRSDHDALVGRSKGRSALAPLLLVLALLVLVTPVPTSSSAEEHRALVSFGAVSRPEQADGVRKLLGETMRSLPTAEVTVGNYEDLKLSVVRIENSTYCERVDCMNLVLIDGLPPLMIMGRTDVPGSGASRVQVRRQSAGPWLQP